MKGEREGGEDKHENGEKVMSADEEHAEDGGEEKRF